MVPKVRISNKTFKKRNFFFVDILKANEEKSRRAGSGFGI
jgi:hypothetical protein